MKVRKSAVTLWVLVLLGMVIVSGCSPVTVETPVLTPDIAATVEAAVATALASQPTPDVAATVEVAVAAVLASQPTPDIAVIVDAVIAAQTAQAEPTVTTGCYDVGVLKWCNTSGGVERKDDSVVLHNSIQKTEMLGNVVSENLDCVFVLKFDHGMSDSSVGLEIWDPLEYSITFRGGAIKVVTTGIVVKTREVASYIGKRIEVHLRASDERLFAAIDGVTLLDEENTYWEGQVVRPRLNADIGDTITLYSSSCTIE